MIWFRIFLEIYKIPKKKEDKVLKNLSKKKVLKIVRKK